MGNFNLTEAAKEILGANVAAKKSGQEHGVGDTKLSTSVAYGTHDAGIVGQSPEEKDDALPDYLKGTPTATAPGATPPVGSEPAKHLSGQPQQTMGRSELTHTAQSAATDYEAIRDRKAGKLAPQMMPKNHGATFQSYGEDVEAMLSGEDLSEDFKEKAAVIFEAAVNARANEVIEAAQVDLQEQFEIAVEEIKEELSQKVDDYLNYMVEEWINENEIAITKGLRAEVIEEFITGLHNLFVEHHIDIPEEKVDVVEELVSKVEELESELNEQISSSIEMKKELNEHKKIEAIYAACEGLTQTQVEKIKSLAEGVEFTTDEEFASKLETIKESYIGSSVKSADNSALDDEVQIVEEKKVGGYADPEMEIFAKTISKTINK